MHKLHVTCRRFCRSNCATDQQIAALSDLQFIIAAATKKYAIAATDAQFIIASPTIEHVCAVMESYRYGVVNFYFILTG